MVQSTRAPLPLALALLLLAACAAPGSGPVLEPGRGASRPVRTPLLRAPEWSTRPLSTAKLASIDTWLQTEGRRADDFWVVEGHLVLSEGNLSFGRRGGGAADGPARVAAARGGFQRVLADPHATSAQRQRARMGLSTTAATPASASASAPAGPAGILPRSRWGARRPRPGRMDRARGGWRWITVHHSAMPDARRLDGSLADTSRALREIQAAHMDGEGFGDVGYHFLIDPAGRVFQGRAMDWQGAHAGGTNNVANVGICLLGNFERQEPSDAAVASLHRLIADLRERHGIPAHRVRGHDEWKSTACPGRHLRPHLARYGGGSTRASARAR